jgi:hypothetical protein
MNSPLPRLVIYTSDVQRITGKGSTYAGRMLRSVRQRLGKEKHHPVTVQEFCEHMKLDINQVLPFLR